ncbi:MAG: Gfo/Idh/MocA family oxidoreductase [Prevotella sp.]|nr:Gfo/Idh/MocA family oxidoreductase [Prevotella sp.]
MKEIAWGFIGCGEVTEKKSGPAFNLIAGSHIEAVMSRTEDKARSYAFRHKIKKWYTDPVELIEDPGVNAIYIATPPSSHATYAIMALKTGKPVYVEKPLAVSYEDCVRINRISAETGVSCFVAYYRRYLPYFRKVKELIDGGAIGKTLNIQLRFTVPPRELDYNGSDLPWRLQPDIAGGGYFYDLAPHQLDLLQEIFGVIVRAHGYPTNRGGLYDTEDNISACFLFEGGIAGSGSWCFVGTKDAREDRIEVIGDKGSLMFSVYTYDPILLITESGTKSIRVANPPYVQMPIIRNVVEHLQGTAVCTCDCVSATPVNWAMDRILWKL